MGTFKFKYNSTNYIYVDGCKYIEDNCTYKNAVEVSKAFGDNRLLNEVLSAAHCGTIMQIPQKPDDYEITLEGDRFVISGITEDDSSSDTEEVTEVQDIQVQETVTNPQESENVTEKLPEISDIKPAHKTTDSIMMLGEPLPPQGLFEWKATVHASEDGLLAQVQALHKERQISLVNSILQDIPEYELKEFPRIRELLTKAHDSGYKQGAAAAEQYKELWLQAKKRLDESGDEIATISEEQPLEHADSAVQDTPVTTVEVSEVAAKYGVPAVLLSSCKAYTTKPLVVNDIKDSDELRNDLYDMAVAEHWAYFDGWYAVDVVTGYYRLFVNFDTNSVVSIPVEEIQNITQG